MICPHCGEELSPEEIKKLWAQLGGSQTTDAKRKANSERAKKRWDKYREDKAKKDQGI
jgi:hypothetical protein